MLEQAGEGVDTVQSSVTHSLAANVENLTLTGTSAINGTPTCPMAPPRPPFDSPIRIVAGTAAA